MHHQELNMCSTYIRDIPEKSKG